MTWNTSNGDRVLERAEGALVRQVLTLMVDELAQSIEENFEDAWFVVGVEAFDSLTTSAKLVTLRLVAEHLLEETPQTPELTAVNESTVYAIFRTLFRAIEMEIGIVEEMSSAANEEEWDDCYYWRSLTLQAWCEGSEDGDFEAEEDDDSEFLAKDETCAEPDHWEYLIESLADRILWDRDFELNRLFMDEAPGLAQLKKQFMGIDDDYYSNVAPDVKPDQIETTLQSLRAILRKPR